MRVATIMRYVRDSTLCIAPRARPREARNDDDPLYQDDGVACADDASQRA